ncbi:hypothetical protein [Aeromicrobium wangtongii]|uniref:Uncharacterized protein n=1 Tax=Aeromicrobium wangtongii TaxID=2969247 RepID=A0ABY5M4A1_9ACTN|nr:hypothetical protein [Aeromicrobium wangtongii]MCD9198268.1 hypothetical protein [Aeromicrobium wangtongii]UUP12302.1 hypothetical protein NQV15_10580 [Aeromicrobium wangtongii]
MSERSRGLLSDISWLQVTGSVLAAVTSAWLASRLGVAGTMIGVALGSFVATVGSAIYVRTLDRGKTLLAQTASGAVVERTVQDGEIAEALDEIAEAERSPVRSAEVVSEDERELPWRKIIITTIVVVIIALTTITTYELVSDKSLDGSRGTTIGDTFGGSKGAKDSKDSKDDTKDKGGSGGGDDGTKDTPDGPKPTATPEDGRSTAPAPTMSTPAPTATTPAPAPTPRPSASPTQSAPEPSAPTPQPAE